MLTLAKSVRSHPATVVLDLSRLPRMTSTVLDGFRDLDAELAGKSVRLVCANLVWVFAPADGTVIEPGSVKLIVGGSVRKSNGKPP